VTLGRFDFDADVNLPVAGKTPRSRHASASGARRAARDRGALSVAYVNLLRTCGPLTDNAAADALGRPLSSICSTRNGLGELIEDAGEYETTAWGTKRTKWRAR
jgi:hypothetical protein